MEHMVAVTIAVGAWWRELAEKTATLARRCTGLPVQIIDERAAKETGLSPYFLKFRLFDLVPAENILFFDADLVYVRRWNPRAYADQPEFVCVRDHWSRVHIIADAMRFDIPPDEYFNVGFFIANRTHHLRMFQFAEACMYESASALPEQGPLNAARMRLGIPARFMSRRFNTVGAVASALWDRVEAIGIHDAGGDRKDMQRILSSALEVNELPQARCDDVNGDEALKGRHFRLTVPGHPSRHVSFRDDGTLVIDRDSSERLWFLESDETDHTLLLATDSQVTHQLKFRNGRWHQESGEMEGTDGVYLFPVQGEELLELLRLLSLSPKRVAIVGRPEGLTCALLLKAFPQMQLYVFISGSDGPDREDVADEVVTETYAWTNRRFIINAPDPSASVRSAPHIVFDLLLIADAQPLSSDTMVKWLGRLVDHSFVVFDCEGDAAEVQKGALEMYAEASSQTMYRHGRFAYFELLGNQSELFNRAFATARTGPDCVNEHTAYDIANAYIRSLADYPQSLFQGSGIVICAGRKGAFPAAWVCIQMLRRVGCTLPIELWTLHEGELNRRLRDLVEPFGVRCMCAARERQVSPARILNELELKPYSLLNSRFAKALLLDVDSVALVDPSPLFDAPEFHRHGAMFWPDIGRLGPDYRIWDICRVPFRDEPTFDGRQVLIDKAQSWRALRLTMHLAEYSDLYGQYVNGVGPMFQMAWRMAEQTYGLIHKQIKCEDGLVWQHDLLGRRIFQYAERAEATADDPTKIAGPMLDQNSIELLEDLRHRWNGKTGYDRELTPAEASVAREIARQQVFRYTLVPHERRMMELLDGGHIGEGKGGYEQYWYVREDHHGRLLLHIIGNGHVTCRLHRDEDGVWRGRWAIGQRIAVELVPLTSE